MYFDSQGFRSRRNKGKSRKGNENHVRKSKQRGINTYTSTLLGVWSRKHISTRGVITYKTTAKRVRASRMLNRNIARQGECASTDIGTRSSTCDLVTDTFDKQAFCHTQRCIGQLLNMKRRLGQSLLKALLKVFAHGFGQEPIKSRHGVMNMRMSTFPGQRLCAMF